ncbi:hypothetical protein DFO62_105290 [Serratia fonticola]|nr:hypothetical protein DFO62_105290 [Serratia fonticola]
MMVSDSAVHYYKPAFMYVTMSVLFKQGLTRSQRSLYGQRYRLHGQAPKAFTKLTATLGRVNLPQRAPASLIEAGGLVVSGFRLRLR